MSRANLVLWLVQNMDADYKEAMDKIALKLLEQADEMERLTGDLAECDKTSRDRLRRIEALEAVQYREKT